jgi:hypothetical protein
MALIAVFQEGDPYWQSKYYGLRGVLSDVVWRFDLYLILCRHHP